MTEWFEALTSFQKTYWILTIITTFLFLLVLISTIIGADTDDIGDVDALACGSFRITVEVDCDSTELGQILCTHQQVLANGGHASPRSRHRFRSQDGR